MDTPVSILDAFASGEPVVTPQIPPLSCIRSVASETASFHALFRSGAFAYDPWLTIFTCVGLELHGASAGALPTCFGLIIALEGFWASLALAKNDTRSGAVTWNVLRVDLDKLQVFSIRSDQV